MTTEKIYKEKMIKLLMDEFDYPYCFNCRHDQEGEEHRNSCEDCYRKNIKWQVSEQKAEQVFNKIINLTSECLKIEIA